MNKLRHGLPGLLLLAVTIGCTAPPAPEPTAPIVNLIDVNGAHPESTETVTITEVYDGDTYTLEDGRKLRLLGVDTPELKATAGLTKAQAEAEKCYGKESTTAVRDKLVGEKVTIMADPEQGDHDRYQRILRYITLPDGTDLGAWIIDQGLGRVYNEYRVAKSASYDVFENQADTNNRGGWAACGWTR